MSLFSYEFLATVLDANSDTNSTMNMTNSTTVPVYSAKDPWFIVWMSA